MKQKSDILENVTLRIIEALYAEFPCSAMSARRYPKLAPPLGAKYARFRNTLPIKSFVKLLIGC